MADGPTAEEQALATTLFRDAKALLEAGRVPEACRKLEESERLSPGGGTLLNIAVCHEKEGKTATAWAEYRQARLIAERDQRDDRLELIDERMKLLEPQLSRLVIDVASAIDLPGMEITVDERIVRRPAWGTQMPLDPGEHVIEAHAPAKKTWHAQVSVQAGSEVKTVAVPAWEDETQPAAVVVAPTVLVRPSSGEGSPPSSGHPNRTVALIAAGTGVAGIALGTIFGIRAITKQGESSDACTRNPCSSTSVALNDSAKSAADISTIAFAVGLVGLGVGAYFWFFTGGTRNASRRLHAAPMGLGGTF
jgi:hypothetical protein